MVNNEEGYIYCLAKVLWTMADEELDIVSVSVRVLSAILLVFTNAVIHHKLMWSILAFARHCWPLGLFITEETTFAIQFMYCTLKTGMLILNHSVQTNPAVYTGHPAVLDWFMKENWRSHDKKWQPGEIFPPHLKAVYQMRVVRHCAAQWRTN